MAGLFVYLSIWDIQYTTPYTTLALTPYTITGPAIVNIFAAVPRIMPSAGVRLGTITSCSVRTQF